MPHQLSLNIVAGAPRSGTTLLQAILSGSSRTNPLIGETRFLRHFLEFYREVVRIWDDDARYCFKDRASAAEIARDGIAAVVASVAAKYHAEHVVLKSPELGRYAPELRAVLGSAVRCYLILRDPRDIVALQWLASIREAALGFEPSMISEPASAIGMRPTDEQVQALARRLLDYHPADAASEWICVGYEALVSQPRETLAALRAASGLSITFDPQGTWANVEFDYLRSSRTLERAWSSGLWGQPVTASRVGVYHEVLSADQATIVEEICTKYMIAWQAVLGQHKP